MGNDLNSQSDDTIDQHLSVKVDGAVIEQGNVAGTYAVDY